MQEPPPFVPGDVNAQIKLSQYLVAKNLVTLLPDKQVLIVEDNKKKYLVQFEPYTCTCGVYHCHHILAARISCGLKTKKNYVVDDINDDDLVLEGNIATEETTTDTSNCKCKRASKALLIACHSGQSPNCKGYYHHHCENVSMAIYFKKQKPKPYWECSACFQITRFPWAPLPLTIPLENKMYKIPPELSQLRVSLDLALVGSFEEAILSWTKHLHNMGTVPLYQTSTCSNSYCSNKEVITRINLLNK
uniref:SWIM-type domain-containing protein n=1 Tax=Romanomermis culicivorax TaxID=13658 RepID=A0A915HHJ2_ROMCU